MDEAELTLVSIDEYLATTYRPDREYIDGVLQERNWGEWDHGWLQAEILRKLSDYRESTGLLAVPEVRVQVKKNRYRVPDISLTRGRPGEQILTRPPFLCVEILSPTDSMSSMQERIDDYVAFGVENIWIVDPRRRKCFWANASGIYEAAGGILKTQTDGISLDLNELWP